METTPAKKKKSGRPWLGREGGTRPCSIAFTLDDFSYLKETAEREGVSLSAIVRMAIDVLRKNSASR